jgi:hypothetical protein
MNTEQWRNSTDREWFRPKCLDKNLSEWHSVHRNLQTDQPGVSDYITAQAVNVAVPWLRRLVASLSPRRPGFDRGSVHVGFVALEQVIPPVLRFSPVNFIPPVLHRRKNEKKLLIFITGLHNKP